MSNMIPYRRHGGSLSNPSTHSLFDDSFFAPFFDMGDFFGSSAFRVDIKDKKDHYELDAELPGVPQEQIELSVENGMLTISANMDTQRKEEKENYVYSERRRGHFQRSFSLEGVREDDIKASYQNGVLTVTLPKEKVKEEPARRRINID